MDNKGEIIIYQNKENHISLNVRLEAENVWLTQANLVNLYQSSKSNVSEHIKHIFEEGELDENSVVRNFRTTASDGKNYETVYYNLDLIISLGYHIKSRIATQFRIWATQRLKEYLIKGFTMDDVGSAYMNTYNNSSGGDYGSWSSGSGGGSNNCASYQRRYNEMKAKLEKETKGNDYRQASATGKNAAHSIVPDKASAATSGDYHVINGSKAIIRGYERQMESIARQAQQAGCSVY